MASNPASLEVKQNRIKAFFTSGSLPVVVCVGWALGTVSMGALNFAKNYVLLFMTTHLGIAAVTGALILTGAKVFDAVTDPVMGLISDRTRTRWGRRRPYLLGGSFLAGLGYIALFIVPDFGSQSVLITYICLVMCFYAFAYTVFGVPHLAMSAEIASTYHERTYLMSYRAVFAILGISAGGALVPYLIDFYGNGELMSRPGFEGMALTMGVVVATFCLLSFFLTSRAKFVAEPDTAKLSLAKQFKLASQNRPFFVLLSAKASFLIATNLVNGTSLFYVTYILGESAAWLGNFFIVLMVATLISQPFWLKLTKRFGKKRIYYIGALIFSASCLSWLWASADEHAAIFLTRAFMFGISAGGMMLAGNAMLPDTMDYDSKRTGLRREGIFAGLYSTMEKFAAAAGTALLGLILGVMGFIESKEGVIDQPDSAILAIYLCNSVFPVILTGLACFILRYYDLSESKLENTHKADGVG